MTEYRIVESVRGTRTYYLTAEDGLGKDEVINLLADMEDHEREELLCENGEDGTFDEVYVVLDDGREELLHE